MSHARIPYLFYCLFLHLLSVATSHKLKNHSLIRRGAMPAMPLAEELPEHIMQELRVTTKIKQNLEAASERWQQLMDTEKGRIMLHSAASPQLAKWTLESRVNSLRATRDHKNLLGNLIQYHNERIAIGQRGLHQALRPAEEQRKALYDSKKALDASIRDKKLAVLNHQMAGKHVMAQSSLIKAAAGHRAAAMVALNSENISRARKHEIISHSNLIRAAIPRGGPSLPVRPVRTKTRL